MRHTYTALSLFSGIGGTDLAFESQGINTVGVCELDDYCREILRQHFPNAVQHKDVFTLDGKLYEGVDIVITTPPCQPVSVAGTRKGDIDDRWLWGESLRVIREAKPILVFGENVKGLLTKGIEGITSDLEGEGYQVRTYLLAASDCGAIHQRERVFIVGYKDWRQTTNTTSYGCNGSERITSVTQVNEWSAKGEDKTQYPEGRSGVRTLLPFRDMSAGRSDIPSIRGVDDGFSIKLDKEDKQRIKALGNSVVPQQILPFVRGIISMLDEYYEDI